jgi:oligoribonuclease NrnB/cAMP/cGMP phosphodiesterase (DHH superfamily)
MKSIAVFYHAGCPDGFGGAYAAWKKFGNRAAYHAFQHQRPLPVMPADKNVYFIDIVATEKDLTKLKRTNKRVTAIDHHAMMAPLVKTTHKGLFNNNHSGAVLAWQYFHGKKSVPRLLKNVEDIDLWRFKVPQSRAIASALELIPFDFKKWDAFAKELESASGRAKIIAKGRIIHDYEQKIIDHLVHHEAMLVRFAGIKTLAVNAPILHSEIGNALYKKLPPIGIVWRDTPNMRKFSLRSNGKVDVAKLAKRFGGGGHKVAAGFRMPLDAKLPWKRLRA